MLVAGFLFAAAGVCVKIGARDFGVAELGFYRSVFTMLVGLAVITATGGTVRSAFIGTHLLRRHGRPLLRRAGVFGTIATLVLWNDTLTPLAWTGMAVIVASGILAMRVEKKQQVEEAGFES